MLSSLKLLPFVGMTALLSETVSAQDDTYGNQKGLCTFLISEFKYARKYFTNDSAMCNKKINDMFFDWSNLVEYISMIK